MPRQQPEAELRRLAMQIAAKLPSDPAEARQTLKRVNELLDLALDDTRPWPCSKPADETGSAE